MSEDIKWYMTKEFNAIASIITVISFPTSFALSGYYRVVVFLLGITFFAVLMFKVFKLIEKATHEFSSIHNIIKEISPENFTCVHNCKNSLSGGIVDVRQDVQELLERINNNEESLEIITINKSNIIVIAQQNSSKNHKMVLKGKNINNVSVSNNVQEGLKFANEILLKKADKSEDSDVETCYMLNLKQGINIGVFQLISSISTGHDSEISLEIIAEDRSIVSKTKLA